MKKPSEKSIREARERHDKALKRIKLLEKKFPAVTKVTRHPTYGQWMPTVFAVVEVSGTLLVIFVILPFLLSLLPDFKIPFPHINLPKINLPTIPLPDINLPQLPELPQWLEDVLYWAKRTAPIWIALGFAIHELRKRNKEQVKSKAKPGHKS